MHYDVFTLAWSGTGTGTGTGTGIMQNLSHCTRTWKNISIHHRAHFQDLKNGYQTHSSGPENVPGVLPYPCAGAVWKVLIKTIQPILPSPCPVPHSGPSQCEYTITVGSIPPPSVIATRCHFWGFPFRRGVPASRVRGLPPSRRTMGQTP